MSSGEERMTKLEELLNQAWREHRAEVVARIDSLRKALADARAGSLENSVREEANSTAHKLAGVLGTFGLKEASRAALDIERILAPDGKMSGEEQTQFEARLGVIAEGLVKRDAEAA